MFSCCVQMEYKSQFIKIPAVRNVPKTIYETKMIPVQVRPEEHHDVSFSSTLTQLDVKLQVARTVLETITIEVPFRDIKVPVRQVHANRIAETFDNTIAYIRAPALPRADDGDQENDRAATQGDHGELFGEPILPLRM